MNYKWEWSYLGEVISYMSKGIVPSYATETSANTIIVLNQKCNRNFQINLDFVRENDLDKKAVPQDRVLKEGDILINSTGTGTAGRIAQLTKAPVPMTVDGHMIIVRSNHYVNPYYLGYALKEKQAQIESLAEGSTGQTEINRTRLCSEIVVRYPSDIYIQEKIVGFLRTLDDKIELNQKINENLERQAFALFENLLADAPDEECVISDIAILNPRRSIAKNQLAKCIDMAHLPTSGAFPTGWETKPFNGGMKFSNGDTLLARITPCLENGKTAFIDFLEDGEVAFGSTEYIVLSPKEGTPPEFLYCLARYPAFVDYAVKNMNGSSGRQRVSADTVGQYCLPKLSCENFEGFGNAVAPLFLKMRYNSLENMRLSVLRDTLLPKLMSGEIDVSNIDL